MRNDLFSVFGNLLAANLFKKGDAGEIKSRTTEVGGENYTYQIYVPPQIDEIENPPVVIFLHGIRERGRGGFLPVTGGMSDFIKQYFKQVPALMLFPQCRPGSYWTDPVMEQMVLQALSATVEEYQADEKRIYLLGVSMGGYGVWHFASGHPGKFAALVSICGGSPIMKGDRFDPIASKIGETPVWLFHGADDTVVPVTESREMVKAIEKIGGNVRYNEYPKVAHNVWMNVLGEKELLNWLFEQKLT